MQPDAVNLNSAQIRAAELINAFWLPVIFYLLYTIFRYFSTKNYLFTFSFFFNIMKIKKATFLYFNFK